MEDARTMTGRSALPDIPAEFPADTPEQVAALREEIANALSVAGAYCGDCTFEPGDRGCTACERHWGWCADAMMPLLRARYAAGLLTAAAVASQAGGFYASRGDNDRAGAAFALMETLQDLAAAAARTPCSDPPCDTDGTGEPCDRHEREQAHAEGDHALCGPGCPERPGAATVHFEQGAVRLNPWTATAFGQDFIVTGTLSTTAVRTWPAVGDDVLIPRLDLPGRGALEDVTGRVTLTNSGPDIILTVGVDMAHLETL